jgi:hypothetical protein
VDGAAELAEVALDVYKALLRLSSNVADAHELIAFIGGKLPRDPDQASNFAGVDADGAAECDRDTHRVAAVAGAVGNALHLHILRQ